MTPETTFREEARVPLWVNDEEADALMSVLLYAADLPHLPGETVERLLMRVSDVQRELTRADGVDAVTMETPRTPV